MAEQVKHLVDNVGLPVDPTLRELELSLCDLAAEWRGNTTQDARARILKEYTETLKKLYELGWDGYLQMDCELPNDKMPKEYLERRKRFTGYGTSL